MSSSKPVLLIWTDTLVIINSSIAKCHYETKRMSFKQTYPLKSEWRSSEIKAAFSTVNIILTKYHFRLTMSICTCKRVQPWYHYRPGVKKTRQDKTLQKLNWMPLTYNIEMFGHNTLSLYLYVVLLQCPESGGPRVHVRQDVFEHCLNKDHKWCEVVILEIDC